MAPDQASGSAQLVPDPFGGELRPWWKELFATRPESKAARRVALAGGLLTAFLGDRLGHLWALVVLTALAGVLPWAIERRERAIRRREQETLVLER